MVKVIRFEDRLRPEVREGCPHREVVVYRADRTVRCAACDALLDPFMVLVELVQGMAPPEPPLGEADRLEREMRRRWKPGREGGAETKGQGA